MTRKCFVLSLEMVWMLCALPACASGPDAPSGYLKNCSEFTTDTGTSRHACEEGLTCQEGLDGDYCTIPCDKAMDCPRRGIVCESGYCVPKPSTL